MRYTWYSAHIIELIQHRVRPRPPFFVHENVVLVRARTLKEAWRKAFIQGKKYAIDDPTLTLNGKPAETVFVGIRGLCEISNFKPGLDSSGDPPTHGTEVTYMSFLLPSRAALKRYVNDKETKLTRLQEGRPDRAVSLKNLPLSKALRARLL